MPVELIDMQGYSFQLAKGLVAWMKPKSFTTDGSVGYNGIHADIYSEMFDMEIMSPFLAQKSASSTGTHSSPRRG
jgi:hypothetical protein